MAKVAFTVDNGLVPGHTDADLGHSTAKFRDAHLSNDLNVAGDVVVGSGGDVTIGGASVQGGGSGGVTSAIAIAYSIALG